jgi:hypothetical protein
METSKTLQKLLTVFTPEQLEIVADVLARAQGRAVDRHCVQSVEINFSERGFVRHVNCSDSVFFSAPGAKMYKAE